MTCPFTVLLNVSVIIAVKRRPSLQSNANILLACLEATDALTGLIVQSSFILQQISHLLGTANHETFHLFHKSSLRTVSVCSYLHLTLVTWRLVATCSDQIYYALPQNCWQEKCYGGGDFMLDLGFSLEILGVIQQTRSKIPFLFLALFLFSCFVFITFGLYVVLYPETLRHKKVIKSSTGVARRRVEISETGQSTQDNCICSRCCCFVLFSGHFPPFT